jgi:hypothetical protein
MLVAGREPSNAEVAAAEIVSRSLGGAWESRDGLDAPDGMHDFDITLTDGSCVALEVTSAIGEDAVRLSDAAFGREGRERTWPAPSLANDWLVTIGPKPNRVAHLIGEVIPLLLVLEQHGMSGVDTRVNPAYHRPTRGTPTEVTEAMSALFRLTVKAAHALNPRPPSQAQVFISISQGLTADRERVNQLVVERAEPKREKLAKATAVARHLFVWMDGTQPEAELAMATLSPPASAPAIPPGIDVVWVATPPLDQPERVWRAGADGWEVLIPPGASDH